MRKVLIGLVVLVFLISIIAPAASAFVWSPPPGPIGPVQPVSWAPATPDIRVPTAKIPKLPDWLVPLPTDLPTPGVQPDEIKTFLSEAEEEALSSMTVGQWVPVYFVLPVAFANDKLIWSSDNENVAIPITSVLIDPMGRRARILPVGSGGATITVRTADDSFFYQFQVFAN